MKSIIPYTKNISFGTKIAEITSMSLEHEFEKKPGEISGNFIVSGEYRSHEVSVNREPFLYKLPFSIELTDRIDLETISFEITDFTYDVVNDDTIEVDIEFSLSADEIIESEEEEEKESAEEGRGIFEKIEDPTIDEVFTQGLDIEPVLENCIEEEIKEEASEKIEETKEMEESTLKESEPENSVEAKEESQIEILEETKEEELEEEKEEVREEVIESAKGTKEMIEIKEDMKESEETVIHNVNPMDDSYATYHIHIVKEGESIETICTMYQSNMNLLTDYNDLNEIHMGDKIIIPKEDE